MEKSNPRERVEMTGAMRDSHYTLGAENEK